MNETTSDASNVVVIIHIHDLFEEKAYSYLRNILLEELEIFTPYDHESFPIRHIVNDSKARDKKHAKLRTN